MKYDTIISAEAWNALRDRYIEIVDLDNADDHTLAELLRHHMWEVEGIE